MVDCSRGWLACAWEIGLSEKFLIIGDRRFFCTITVSDRVEVACATGGSAGCNVLVN